MKQIHTLLFLLIFPLVGFGQSYYYNFDEDGNIEGFTQGGITMAATGGALSVSAFTANSGYQQIRTPDGLNLVESNYTMVRLVVENLLIDNTAVPANHETFKILSYDIGNNSAGSAAQSSNITIPHGAGFQTLDFAIPTNPDNAGVIDRVGLRIQLAAAANISGTLRIDQFIILNTVTVNIATNGDFENNGGELTPWVANGPDVSASLTTGNGGGSGGRLTFDQNATTNNTLENSFYAFSSDQTIQTSTVTVNFDAKKTSAGAVSVGIQMTTKLNGGAAVSKFNGNNTVTSSWAPYSTNRSVDPFDEIRVSLRVKTNDATASAGDTFDFDNVVVNITYYVLTPATAASKTDGNWSDTNSWIAGYIPTSSDDVVLNHNVTIDTNANTKDLTVNSGGSLTVSTGNTLIVSGTSNGNVNHQITLNDDADATNAWYLVGSPVAGEVFDTSFADANDIAAGSNSNRGIASYNPGNTGAAAWTYFTGTNVNATPGQGFSMKITPDAVTSGEFADNIVNFEGTINTADVETISLSTGFNLLANPYTSYVNSATFLAAATSSNLDQSQIWLWNQASGMYEVKTSGIAWVLAPGQGFFVNATSAGTVTFAESNQASSGNAFQKINRTEVKLNITDGQKNRFAKLFFADNFTNGYDFGWEGETFGGVETNFDVFSHLVEGDAGKNYQVQSLPLSEMESTIIPLGLKVNTAQEVTFTTEALNLPSGLKVFLEDRLEGVYTRLDEANSNYKTQVASGNSEGRFFLHTNSGALSTDSELLNSISIYKSNATTLRIVGLSQGEANVKLFNLLGKQVMSSNFNTTGVKELALPKLATGVYIVQLETEAGKLNKKIVLE